MCQCMIGGSVNSESRLTRLHFSLDRPGEVCKQVHLALVGLFQELGVDCDLAWLVVALALEEYSKQNQVIAADSSAKLTHRGNGFAPFSAEQTGRGRTQDLVWLSELEEELILVHELAISFGTLSSHLESVWLSALIL